MSHFPLWQHRSGVWYLLYGDRLKQRISTGHKDRALAEQVKAEMEAKFPDGNPSIADRGHKRRTADKNGEVYFVHAPEVSRVKIGWATSLGSRFQQIEVLSPVSVVLLGTIPGSRETERQLHSQFAAQRLHSEWFDASGDLLSTIAGILDEYHGVWPLTAGTAKSAAIGVYSHEY